MKHIKILILIVVVVVMGGFSPSAQAAYNNIFCDDNTGAGSNSPNTILQYIGKYNQDDPAKRLCGVGMRIANPRVLKFTQPIKFTQAPLFNGSSGPIGTAIRSCTELDKDHPLGTAFDIAACNVTAPNYATLDFTGVTANGGNCPVQLKNGAAMVFIDLIILSNTNKVFCILKNDGTLEKDADGNFIDIRDLSDAARAVFAHTIINVDATPSVTPCADNNDCAEGEVCNNGTCEPGEIPPEDCNLLDLNCPDGQICNLGADNTGTCADSCPNGSTQCELAEGYCTPAGNLCLCTTDDDCGEGDTCQGSGGFTTCQPAPPACDNGIICNDVCVEDATDCLGQTCDSNDDCNVNETCTAGACVPGDGFTCAEGKVLCDGDCIVGDTCPDPVCAEGEFLCGGACVSDAADCLGDACDDATDCADGQTCEGDPKVCTEPVACTGIMCAGVCVEGATDCLGQTCENNDDCNGDEICTGDPKVCSTPPDCAGVVCAGACIEGADSCVGQVCNAAAAVDECGVGAACCMDTCLADSDGDTIGDGCDNCPSEPNVDQANFDAGLGDTLGDACDPDIDNDGVFNDDDDCDNTPADEIADIDATGCSPSEMCIDGQVASCGVGCEDDTDADSVGDSCDNCVGIANTDQANFDQALEIADGDAEQGDVCDEDEDQDGVNDTDDACLHTPNDQVINLGVGANGCSSAECPDASGEVMCNGACVDPASADGDTVPDACDTCPDVADESNNPASCAPEGDNDDDGVPNDIDNCPLFNPDQLDANGDGVGDMCQSIGDKDGDGINDSEDNCPLFNPDQLDENEDGVGDACQLTGVSDGDQDGDGIPDSIDNCPIPNPDQLDDNGDGVGDICQPNLAEVPILGPGPDGDGDGLSDILEDELAASKHKCLSKTNPDSDSDGVNDRIEVTNTNLYDPCDPDGDKDGILDGEDNCPILPNPKQKATDCPDDHDGDKILNGIDNCPFLGNPKQENDDKDALGNRCDPKFSEVQSGGGSILNCALSPRSAKTAPLAPWALVGITFLVLAPMGVTRRRLR
jgi:hypothetical protein